MYICFLPVKNVGINGSSFGSLNDWTELAFNRGRGLVVLSGRKQNKEIIMVEVVIGSRGISKAPNCCSCHTHSIAIGVDRIASHRTNPQARNRSVQRIQ